MPTLRAIAEGPHQLVGVVSQPDRARGRGRKHSPSPVAAFAQATDVPLLRPEKAGAPEVIAALSDLAPDIGVVAAFGQFLTKRVRELPARGYLINAHASLLPRHRGAAPIAHAILAGDTHTGISVMRVDREMDAGPVANVVETPIGDGELLGELEQRLGELAAGAIAEALDAIAEDRIAFTAQDEAAATLAPKIERGDAALDPTRPAEELARRVRAMSPRPGAFLLRGGEPLRVLAATVEAGDAPHAPGTVVVEGERVRIATGSGWLVPTRLQRAGGKALDAASFQRGRGFEQGERLEAA